MKKFQLSILFCILMASFAFSQDENAKVTKVVIRFDTHNDNKDHDTKLNVTIKTKVSIFLSKIVALGVAVGGDMEFVDPSSHTFDLVLASENLKVKDLIAPFVSIDIQPNGNDRWVFDYTVTITCDNGDSFISKSQGVILDQDNKHFEGVFSN